MALAAWCLTGISDRVLAGDHYSSGAAAFSATYLSDNRGSGHTRSARGRLKARREPHWRSISDGLAIGYRKGAKGGTWIARHYTVEAGRRFYALGAADDVADADGAHASVLIPP
jgi:hypothetical protein